MEPHCVVDRGGLQLIGHEHHRMRHRRDAQQRQIRKVRQHRLVDAQIVGQCGLRAHPDPHARDVAAWFDGTAG
ncbi:hypothetical protein SDC9_144906 [bioreactor metagenome]|uniref:Uncharacterized protein n=1 Tax=bioreactor metagenome TaxID=1076179 RepID=A0A645E8J3_9ZZZZ